MVRTSDQKLPVIDVSPLAGADETAKRAVAASIRAACIEWGFFYVTGYGKLQDDVDAMIEADKAFFDLPAAEKARFAAALSPLHRGYTPQGGAHNCSSRGEKVPDQKESFLLGEDWFLHTCLVYREDATHAAKHSTSLTKQLQQLV
jgi:isopenicillin N synthase-like dioxygenase